MQAVTPSQTIPEARPAGLAVSLEWVVYAVLIVLAVWLRVAELDSVPLTEREATRAIAAWRTLHPDLPGSVIVPESPMLYLLHNVSFTLLGASEFSARILTALAGALLVLAPLLFRDVFGRGRTLLLSILLMFSPVVLITSRLDSPVIWAIWSALVGLWALRRWWLRQNAGYALLSACCASLLLVLTDPAGWLFGLVLLGAAAGALAWNRVDNPDDDPLPEMRARLQRWPVLSSLLAAGLTLFTVATIFMFHLPGMSSVSQLLETGVAGIFNAQAGAPPVFALVTVLFYEPLLVLFGLITGLLLWRRGTFTLTDRFLTVWVLLAGVVMLLYRGTGADHALWLVLPLAGLVSVAMIDFLRPDKHPFLDSPRWGKGIVTVALLGLLTIFAINFQGIARAFLRTADGSLASVQPDAINAVWTLIALLFIIAGYVLVASTWGSLTALRGGALGLLIFGMITSLGSGWSAAVTNASNPVELWHTEATGRETYLLRDTLIELSRRETGAFPQIAVHVLADDSSVIGWTLRDFINVQYINQPDEGRTQKAVLLPETDEPPQLGGSYVGQQFVVIREWQPDTLLGFDLLPLWTQRRTRTAPTPSQTMVLWLRQDVYDGVEFNAVQ
ncbi:MAG: hypothetical protein CL610_03590 [Anaerolineaceae bacterium]|nr:hypothetical protein [Anaerolineaceae bacterium]